MGQRDAWTICRWFDGPALPRWELNDAAVAQALRMLEAGELRQAAAELLEQEDLRRCTNEQLVQQLAAGVLAGELRLVTPGARAPHHDDIGPTLEQRLVRRLRTTSHLFHFEGERLRIVAAHDWAALRGSEEDRYQVVPHAEALPLLERLTHWTALPHDEAQAVKDALPLVPTEWRPGPAARGILLIRIVERLWNIETAGGAEAVTPSQLSRAPAEEEQHFIQIELIDADDQPVPDQAYRIELPDGGIREGRLDKNGQAYIGGLPTGGVFKVCFPQIDTTEWRAA